MTASENSSKIAAFGIRAGLGCALVALLLWLYGPHRISSVLIHESPTYFVAAIGLYVAGQVMSSYRWLLLARLNGLDGSWSEYVAYYFIGMFTNLFVPGLIGGDAARAAYLGLRHGRPAEAVGSVVADRGIGLIALFWFSAIAVLATSAIKLPGGVAASTIGIGVAAFAGYLAAPMIASWVRLLPRMLQRVALPILPYLNTRAGLVPAILLSLVLQASLAICQYLLAIGMGLSLPLSVVMLIVPIANVAASLPITLNGLGVREGAYLLLFGLAGVGHQEAVALGLLWFASTMVGGFFGILPFILTTVPAAPREQDAEPIAVAR